MFASQVAKIETERLLAQMVRAELDRLAAAGQYAGTFLPQFHSYGYEGRSGLPSAFDATYCYVLGFNVAALLALGCNGLISSVTNLTAPVREWRCGGVPITMMCHMEKRHGHKKPVIKKALVELEGAPFRAFCAQRDAWAMYDLYRSPGPIQYYASGFGGSGSGSGSVGSGSGLHGTNGDTRIELCLTLALELNGGRDPRLDAGALAAAIAAQQIAPRAGAFVHAPFSAQIVSEAGTLLSALQMQRALFQVRVVRCS